MKKIYTFVFGLLFIGAAFAAGDNIPTSKNYVDNAIAQKQDAITANDGAIQVLINTGTAGEYGTQGIYDAAGEYAPQAQNLVDAITMNTAVQNAIDSEFQCVEWDENNECMLLRINPSVRDTGILPGDGVWCRAWITREPMVWEYYSDASSSIIMPIQPNTRYKLSWDSNYNPSIYRVAFTKTDTCPTAGHQIALYKSDGTPGAEIRTEHTNATPADYSFIVTDSSIKYIVIQVGGYVGLWETGDYSPLWERISHLHISVENWMPENGQ